MRHRYEILQFPDDFKGLSVLDIGCNIGRICFDAKQRGAARAVGIDNREDVVNAMNGYYKEKGVDVELFAFDINQGYYGHKRLVGDTHFDYIFALSIWSHIDKQKAMGHYKRLQYRKSSFWKTMHQAAFKSLERITSILEDNLHFLRTEFLGFTTDRGVRAVFRLTR